MVFSCSCAWCVGSVPALICCGVQASADILLGQGSGPHSWVAFSTLFLPSGCHPHPLSLLPARPCVQPGWAWALSSRVCWLHLSGGREPLSAAQSSVPDGSLRGLGCVCPRLPHSWVCWAFPVLGAHSPVSAQVPRVTSDLALLSFPAVFAPVPGEVLSPGHFQVENR